MFSRFGCNFKGLPSERREHYDSASNKHLMYAVEKMDDNEKEIALLKKDIVDLKKENEQAIVDLKKESTQEIAKEIAAVRKELVSCHNVNYGINR